MATAEEWTRSTMYSVCKKLYGDSHFTLHRNLVQQDHPLHWSRYIVH